MQAVDQRIGMAREYLTWGARKRKVDQLPPSVLVRELAETRRQLGPSWAFLRLLPGAAAVRAPALLRHSVTNEVVRGIARRHTGWVRVVVTEVTGAGSIRRGVLDTAGQGDPGRWMDLIERAALDLPPPYRPVPGRPVYHIRAGDTVLLVAERELVGPLRALVMTALAPGGAEAGRGHTALPDEHAELGSRPPWGRPVPAKHRFG